MSNKNKTHTANAIAASSGMFRPAVTMKTESRGYIVLWSSDEKFAMRADAVKAANVHMKCVEEYEGKKQ